MMPRNVHQGVASRPRNGEFDESPREYDTLRQCWLNGRRREFISCLLRQDARPVQHVLEIGSGTGWLLRDLAREFPHLRFYGVDPLPNYVEYASSAANAISNLTFLHGAAENVHLLSLPPIDTILSNDVLHHVDQLEVAVDSISRTSAKGCLWHAIEPNWLNPYSFLKQSLTRGERVFWPWPFHRLARHCEWDLRQRQHLFLIPPFVQSPPRWARALERRCERIPMLAGGLYLALQRRDILNR